MNESREEVTILIPLWYRHLRVESRDSKASSHLRTRPKPLVNST